MRAASRLQVQVNRVRLPCRTVGTVEAARNVYKSASIGEVQYERGEYRRQRADAVFDFSFTSLRFLIGESGSSIEILKNILELKRHAIF